MIQRCVSLLSVDKAGENDEAPSCFEGQSNGVKSPPVATWNERSHGNELVAQALRPSVAFPPFFLDFRLPQFLSLFSLALLSLTKQIWDFFHFLNHIDRRIDLFVFQNETEKESFLISGSQIYILEASCVRTLFDQVLRPSLLWFVFDSSLEDAMHILIVARIFNFRICCWWAGCIFFAMRRRYDDLSIISILIVHDYGPRQRHRKGSGESVFSTFVTRCRARWSFRSLWP